MNLLRALIAAAAALTVVVRSHAAQAPNPPATATTSSSDDVIALSPFTVTDTDDKSWQATTTLIGSRTNQELAKLPVTVDVITAEFMRDLGAFNMEEAARFVAGVDVTPRLESRNDDRINYRGLSTGGMSRNFFTWYVPSDTYNVERYDFNKGSNSLMFGDSSPGGQATIYTKRARSRNTTEFFASVGSYDTFRFQLDANRKLRDNLFVRVNLVNRRNATYVKGTNDVFRAGDLAITYEPFKNTAIRVELERGITTRVRADSALAINDVAAPGRGFSTNNQWYYTSDGEILYRTSTFPASVDRSGPSGNQVSLLAGQTATVRLPNGTYKTFSGFDKYTNMLGTVDYNNRIFNVANITLEQRIGKLSLEFAFNQQFQHEDRNDNSFGTSQTPPVISVDGNGRPYIDDGIGGAAFKIFGNIVKAGRAAAVYPFDFGRFGKQLLVVTALRQRDVKFSRRTGLANELGTGPLSNNGVRLRAYLDDPRFPSTEFWDQFLLPNLRTTPTFKPVLYESTTVTGPFADIRYAQTQTASLSGDYFGGRVTSLIGASWNRLHRKIPTEATYLNTDARGSFIHPGLPWENPGAYEYDPRFDLSATSRMAGVTVSVWRGEAATVNVYGVDSESFNWQSRQVFFGPDIGPVRGKTKEVGLKGDLFRRKLTYTLGVYDVKRVNAAYAWLPDVLNLSQLEDLINPNDIPQSDPRYVQVVNGLNNERRTVNSNEQSRGVELTLQGQRWYGLQSRVSFSANRVRAQADFSQFRTYLQAAEERTAAALRPGGDPTMAEPAAVLNNARTVLGANTLTDEVAGRRSVPYTGSFVLDYQVPGIRALRVGVSGIYTPDYNVAIFDGVSYKAGSSLPTNMYVLYDRRFFNKYQTTFRLGLNNVYDVINGNSPYRITGATSYNTTLKKPNYTYRYAEPTSWSFSVTTRL